jgi:lysophospholipase L1-like esterase
MLLPNSGLTVLVTNRRERTLKVGSTILSGKETDHVHFETTKELKHAIKLNNQNDLFIEGVIPQEILDLLEDEGVGIDPTEEELEKAKGLFYRDEFEVFKAENTQKQNEFTTSLAEKVSKVNGTSPDTDGNVTLPIPQVDTTNLATKTELNALGQLKFIGVYATLSTLQTTYPTGTNGIALVTADGYGYYWNGSSWTQATQFQSTGIADNSIDYSKMSYFQKKYYNLFDKTKAVFGIVNTSGGLSSTSGTDWKASDYIPVQEGVTYYNTRFDTRSAYYDANKVFIQNFTPDPNTNVTVPTGLGIKYVRLTLYVTGNSYIDDAMFGELSVKPATYKAASEFFVNVIDSKFTDAINSVIKSDIDDAVTNTTKTWSSQKITQQLSNVPIADLSVTPIKTSFLSDVRYNFFDKSTVTNGFLFTSTGSLSASAANFVGATIPVVEGQTYTSNFNQRSIYVNASNQFVSALNANAGSAVTFTVPTEQGITGVRLGGLIANIDTTMFNIGSSLLAYQPYSYTKLMFSSDKIKGDIANDLSSFMPIYSNLRGKLWVVEGDSITAESTGYWKQISDLVGVTVQKNAVAGSTISNYTPDKCIATRVLNIPSDADIITVMGGTNDINAPLGTMSDRTADTLYGAMHVLCQNLLTNFPGKRIGFMTNPQRSDANIQAIVDAEIAVCNYYSVPILDVYRSGGLNPNIPIYKTNYVPDGLHPNTAGHAILARRILKFVESI